jgi:hypothetical protein
VKKILGRQLLFVKNFFAALVAYFSKKNMPAIFTSLLVCIVGNVLSSNFHKLVLVKLLKNIPITLKYI